LGSPTGARSPPTCGSARVGVALEVRAYAESLVSSDDPYTARIDKILKGLSSCKLQARQERRRFPSRPSILSS
jgi:hypothetical protein